MLSPSLATDLELIQTFCRQNGIALFYGIPEDSGSAPCRWNKEAPEALQEFLAALKTTGAKVLHLTVTHNEFTPGDLQAIQKAIVTQPKQQQKTLTGSLGHLQKETDTPLTLVTTFFYGVVHYTYSRSSPLSTHHKILKALIGDPPADMTYAFKQHKEVSGSHTDHLSAAERPKDDIDALARTIATFPPYIHARHRRGRGVMAKAIVESEGIKAAIGQRQVAVQAERIFKAEMETVREQERTKRIKALQKATPGISKKAIARALNIPSTDIHGYLSNRSN